MKCLYLGILIYLLAALPTGHSQHEKSMIYGHVMTESGQEYTGFLRWGKEEMYWHDIFNSSKIEDSKIFNTKKSKNKNGWLSFDWDFESIWDDKYKNSYHTFACYVGDIAHIDVQGGERIYLYFKNGEAIKLEGGSNDIGATLRVEDYELGTIKIPWKRIEKVIFEEAPSHAQSPYGNALYGVLHTRRKGKYEGYIKWDMDERNGDDILDGTSRKGEREIPFKNIRSITRHGEGADVVLKSGREIFLKNSNDIDSGNRGIEIFQEGIGSVKVEWNEFKTLEFQDSNGAGPAYSDFKIPKGIEAEVMTLDDESMNGFIIFDIDELWEPEMLDGEDDNVTYQIPFSYIQEISPKNREYSIVELKNGKNLLLGESHDVSDSNDGVLVLNKSRKKPKFIDWEEILFIRIK